jgi:hypothetical protein
VRVGVAIAVIGAQAPIGQLGTRAWAYGLTATVAVGCFLLYRWVADVVLLVGGIVAATVVVPEVVSDLTNGGPRRLGDPADRWCCPAGLSAVGLRLRASGGDPAPAPRDVG